LVHEVSAEDIPNGEYYYDEHSGFYYSVGEEEWNKHKRVNQYVKLEGILRKGEEQDWLRGRRISKREGTAQRVDLKRMVGYFGFHNEGSDYYYLERAVEDLEKAPQQLPVPTDFSDTMKHVEDYERDSNYKKLKTLRNLSLLGVIGSAFL